ncbi:hypothetical protein LCGC14_0174630 [marine sediment metagenome]|uniref:Uncharacterized protein n=1 Tax=marine sediment metagenome TaxID=412755 RepID=A0A0F9UV22_9ZZZZ
MKSPIGSWVDQLKIEFIDFKRSVIHLIWKVQHFRTNEYKMLQYIVFKRGPFGNHNTNITQITCTECNGEVESYAYFVDDGIKKTTITCVDPDCNFLVTIIEPVPTPDEVYLRGDYQP